MPAPATHGVGRWLATGKLPEGCGTIQKSLAAMRHKLTAAIDSLRTRTIADDLMIQSVARHEGIALLWMRWLAAQAEALSIEQKLAISKEIRAATADRDRAVAALRISDSGKNVLDALYREPASDA